MATVNEEALSGLAAAIAGLLPEVPDPALQPALMIVPMSVTLTGLGGFVGLSQDPPGEIHGRRVRARVVVTVKAATPGGVSSAIQTTIQAFVGAEAATLRPRGILRIGLAEGMPPSIGPLPAPDDGTAEGPVAFDVLYELVKGPAASEDVIQTVPVQVSVGAE